MFNFYFTNPATNMLLGFETQEVKIVDLDEKATEGTMFSLGAFFFRIDILFNIEPIEEE